MNKIKMLLLLIVAMYICSCSQNQNFPNNSSVETSVRSSNLIGTTNNSGGFSKLFGTSLFSTDSSLDKNRILSPRKVTFKTLF